MNEQSGWLERGYKHIYVNGKGYPEHRLIAEKAMGKSLPKGAVVHHMDENTLNNANNNLCICPSAGYHKILHKRLDAFKAAGNPNWGKCPYCYQHDDPIVMRREKSGRCVHKKCSADAQKAARLKRNKK